jgi:hypothetical protein
MLTYCYKWVDEDEQQETEDISTGMGDLGGLDFSQMMGGAGMGSMGGMDMEEEVRILCT